MRIAMIGQKKVPSREGGIEVVAEKLAMGLAQKGHSVTLYNRKSCQAKSCGNSSLHKNIRIYTVCTINRKGLAAISASFSGAVLAAFGRFDIVHFHAEGPSLFCWIPKLTGKKVIVTVHGLDWQREKWGKLAGRIIKQGEKAAVRHADAIIVLSENIKSYFLREYGRETQFIPNGAEVSEQRINGTKDSYILFLGRLVPEKGVHDLIAAFQKVKNHPFLEDKQLIIAGASSDTDAYYQQLLKLAGDEKRIVFAGFVQGQRLAELFSNAYLYVLPSATEGMPLSLLEAMSYGNCCVVSDISELTEVVEEYGIISRQGNVDDLAEKLLTAPQEIRRYQRAAREFILQKYNWDTTVERTMELYENTLHQ